MADNMLIDGLIKFCDEKSKNIKLKAEPQVFVEIKQALGELKEIRKGIKEIPVATIKISKEDMQKIVDEKVAQIELDIQGIRAEAIDEFVERLRMNTSEYEVMDGFGAIEEIVDAVDIDTIFEIAEQLKAGGK